MEVAPQRSKADAALNADDVGVGPLHRRGVLEHQQRPSDAEHQKQKEADPAQPPGNREAQQYSGFLGFAAAIPFIVFSIFLTDLQSPVVYALALFPLTTPTSMLIVLGVSDGIPWTLVGASLTSLGLFAILATWASARIFRATVLLYGVRPTLPQIIGAVRSPR